MSFHFFIPWNSWEILGSSGYQSKKADLYRQECSQEGESSADYAPIPRLSWGSWPWNLFFGCLLPSFFSIGSWFLRLRIPSSLDVRLSSSREWNTVLILYWNEIRLGLAFKGRIRKRLIRLDYESSPLIIQEKELMKLNDSEPRLDDAK